MPSYMISRNGKTCATIMICGQHQMKMGSVCLTGFYVSGWRPNVKRAGMNQKPRWSCHCGFEKHPECGHCQGKRLRRGKKTSGIKLHIGVDILGLPHPIMVTTADVTDHNGAVEMVDYYNDVTNNLSLVKKVLVDGGYAGKNFANSVKSLIQAEVEVAKRNELHPFAVILKCWVVECSFGWLDKCRRLWKNCERDMQNSFQMVVIAFIRLLLKRC